MTEQVPSDSFPVFLVTTPATQKGGKPDIYPADEASSIDGCLMLFKDSHIITLIAPGHWRKAERFLASNKPKVQDAKAFDGDTVMEQASLPAGEQSVDADTPEPTA